jgi:hypothetical protein
MVKIDWTTAQTVRIEARKDFTMSAATVAIRKGDYTVQKTVQVEVPAERVLYFSRSSFEGWYYLLMYSEAQSRFDCTCPAGRLQHKCGHAVATAEYADQRTQREQERTRTETLSAARSESAELLESIDAEVCEQVARELSHAATRPSTKSEQYRIGVSDEAEALRERDRVTAELVLFRAGIATQHLDLAS